MSCSFPSQSYFLDTYFFLEGGGGGGGGEFFCNSYDILVLWDKYPHNLILLYVLTVLQILITN